MEAANIQGGLIMAGINFYNANSISALFSSLGNNSTGGVSAFGSIDYSTYASIKSGSYRKLLNAYYERQDSVSGSENGVSTDETDKSYKTEKANATSVRDSAASVNDAVEALNTRELWKKKEVTDKDGNKSYEYDKDAIYKAVSDFVKEYNVLVDGAGDSSDNRVLRSAQTMVGFTKANKKILNDIGISIGKDNKLSIDESKFKKSDMVDVKSAFFGAGSYGKSVAGNASMIYGSAVAQLARMSSTNIYGQNGSFNYMTGSYYNRFL